MVSATLQEYIDELRRRGYGEEECRSLSRFIRSFSVGRSETTLSLPFLDDFTAPEVIEYYESRIREHIATAPITCFHPCACARGTPLGKTMSSSMSHRMASAFNSWEPLAPAPFTGPLIDRMIVSEPLGLARYEDSPYDSHDAMGHSPACYPAYNYPPPLLWADSTRRERDRQVFRERITAWLSEQPRPRIYLWSGLTGRLHHLRVLCSSWCLDTPLFAAVPARGTRDISRQARALRNLVENALGMRPLEWWNNEWDAGVRFFTIPTWGRPGFATTRDVEACQVTPAAFSGGLEQAWERVSSR